MDIGTVTAVGISGAAGKPVGAALVQIALAAVILAGMQLALFTSGPNEPKWIVALFPLVALTYVGAGLTAWYRRPSNHTGALLTLGGLVFFIAGLTLSAIPILIAAGLIVATVPVGIVLHVLMAFPSGRLRSPGAQLLVAAGYFTITVLEAPKYLFRTEPSGLLQLADRPDLVDIGRWAQGLAAAAILVLASVLLVRRLQRATPAQRRTLAPLHLLGVATIIFLPLSVHVLLPLFDLSLYALGAMQLIALALIPVAFGLGVLRGGFTRTGAIEDLGVWLGSGQPGPHRLRDALMTTLGDPSLEVLYWLPDRGTYVNVEGATVERPAATTGRVMAEIEVDGEPAGAIVYDGTLQADPGPVRAAVAVVAIVLDRDRRTAELRAAGHALRESRDRVVKAEDRERRRIARDLHDGLQARLTLLALQTHAAMVEPNVPDGTRTTVVAVRTGLYEAIDELRRLVHGLMPTALVERGLVAAIEDLVDRVPLPTSLDVPAEEQELPPLVESTAYFVVAEGLSNALKHSHATALRVRLSRSDARLDIEVEDNGVGGATFDDGDGIRGLLDRLEAVGGRLALDSPPGAGTRLKAEMPCGS